MMKAVDFTVFLFAIKLIGLLCIAFIIIIYAPQYSHYLLLVIAAALSLLGIGSLLKYKEQTRWIEKKAKLISVKECEEEVAISEYAKLKYYYPMAEYEYVANGATRLGNTVSLEKENVWVPEANYWGDPTPKEKRWWLSLQPGDELPVYVNPHNELEAVLVKGVSNARRSHHLALLLGGILLGLIWFFLVYYNLTMPPSGS